MQRPSDVDLRYFVDQGIAARGSLIDTYGNLPNFREGGPWDIQRIGSDEKPTRPFIDSANVAIGLYGASAGISQGAALNIANGFAAAESNFKDAPRDDTYTHLRKENVYDIKLGYSLYQSGKIGPTGIK